MYRVITYRSKLLKKSTYTFDEISAMDYSIAAFDEPESGKKKKKKKKEVEEQVYEINGEKVREEDLSIDEKLDMEAEALLNVDGFYDALLPLDYFENEQAGDTPKKKTNVLGIVLVILGTVIILGSLAFVYFYVLS